MADLHAPAHPAPLTQDTPHTPDTPHGYPRERSLTELFTARAALRPHDLAARHHDRTLTYGQLAARSDDFAARLAAHGIEPGSPVGVCGSRSLEALVAFLGILKAGCAYVPLDEELPPARLRAMAEDAGLRAAAVLPGSGRRIRGLPTRIEVDAVDTAAELPGAPAPATTA
ncbi:AMP-binding protein, partial [Streptomyces sp. URMC 127]|uniref:AMP-binding protein n=1 Tax=Streptomyces sp. URMC 127 TaxID=3423402 RepID=UPI003F1A9545